MEKYCMNCMCHLDTGGLCPYCGYDGKLRIVPHHLTPGTVLSGRYLVGNALGHGGFGITYIGRDLKLDMKVAVKEYYPNGYASRNTTMSAQVTISGERQQEFFEEGKAKFYNEARALALFSGKPGVVDVRDFFEENNTAYIIMEYLDGQNLREYINEHGVFPANVFFDRIAPILDTLEMIHAQNIIHRDISPDNIMILKDGTLKLMDFGAARVVDYSDQKSMSIILKAGYAPEEQYRSKGQQGPWTDVYALCATIYKCITGITPDDSLERIFNDELKPPSALGIPISPSQEIAIMKGLEVKYQLRCQDIAQFKQLLNSEIMEDIHSGETDEDTMLMDLPEPDGPSHKEEEIQSEELPQSSVKLPQPRESPARQENGESKSLGLDSVIHDRKRMLIVGAALLLVLLTGIFFIVGSGTSKKGQEQETMIPYPTERQMTSDAAKVLKKSGIEESVLALKVLDSEKNEKYQTYILECQVTLRDGIESEERNIRLVYELESQKWNLSSQSKVLQ